MEEPALLELIDQYLMGSIRPEDKVELERMMGSDPEIEALVDESRKAFNVLQAARNRQLREKLRALDKVRHASVWILATLDYRDDMHTAIIGGSWCWASYYFSNKTIATRYFKMAYHPVEELVLNDEMKMIWEEADNAFRSEDYGRASNLYNSILKNTEQSVLYNANGIFLCQIWHCMVKLTGWRQAIETFANEAPSP